MWFLLLDSGGCDCVDHSNSFVYPVNRHLIIAWLGSPWLEMQMFLLFLKTRSCEKNVGKNNFL